MAHTVVTHNELRDRFDAPERYVGYKVLDPEGRSIGRVEVIFTNARDEPEYVNVRLGFFGLRSVLIPVAGSVLVEREQRALIFE
jgi:hypothetical protein